MAMNLSQVEAFRAVMLSRSTTAASRILHTSQPNVSRLIAQLEKSIGFKLFERSPGKLTPTEEGLAFFNEVQRSFVGLEQLDDAAGKIRRFGIGLLRIGAVPSIALGMLPRAVTRFQKTHPDVGLSLHMGHSSTIQQWIDAQFCDIGVIAKSATQASSMTEPLFRINSVCVMPQNHRLTAKEQLTPEDFEGEAFISFARSDTTRLAVDSVFEAAGVEREMNIETPHSSVACSLTAMGMGVCIVNPLVAHEHRHLGLVTRPFVPAVQVEGFLIFPKGRPISRLAAQFSEVLQQVAHEECQVVQPT